MFQSDVGTFSSSSCRSETPSMCSTSSSTSFSEPFLSFSNKRSSSEMSSGSVKDDSCQFQGFCVGVGSFSFLLKYSLSFYRLFSRRLCFQFVCLFFILEDRQYRRKMPGKRKEPEEKYREWPEVIRGTPKGKGLYQGRAFDSMIVSNPKKQITQHNLINWFASQP